ncbi:cytochrome P450 [Streptomyces ureilyticus]|uniref:Cytochrome P450 n=1 Tax=Streptomyces ureilyticus TaxID=1775131 RepID=A0ABX0DFI7_9ACTN|nr:cytochrome P450 [Streptomyces ureilyticus]NGO40630.1 cytochrome P450 [Streptomyces ureilyticus]
MLDEPAEFYAGLRAHGPVVRVHLDGDVPAWLVTGYDACSHVLRNGLHFTRNLGQWNIERSKLPQDWALEPHVTPMENMLFAQGDEHVRLRDAFRASLRKVGPGRRDAAITRAADQLIDAFVDEGRADLVGQYAVPLPVAVLTELFGFPPGEAERLQRVILTLLNGGEGALAANAELIEVIGAHVNRRLREPRADIVTGLLEAGLTVQETTETVWLSINAGIGSTTAWTANACELLARVEDTRSDLNGMLRDIPGVVAEVLWDHTPVQQVIGRVATADVDLMGASIRRGDLCVVSLAAANLDPRFGSDGARAANIAGNGSHLSYGLGAHECPAQSLAAALVEGGVGRLWARLDDLHLTRPEQPTQWSPSIIVRIPARLDVSFDAARARARATIFAPTGDR